jgi:peptide/nickel transport system permease protein
VLAFVRKRLIASLVAVLIVTVVVFVLARVQGDPRIIYIGENMTQATYEELGRQLGLDRSLAHQYLVFLGRLAAGDLGVSLHEHRPVLDIVMERLPATLQLAAAGFVFSLLVGVPLGVLAAVRRGSLWDRGGRMLAVLGQSLPSFWVGIMGIFVFSVQLGWLPPFGAGGPEQLETLGSQYVLLARAKGLGRRAVVLRHALRNALLAPLTFAGLTLGGLITGAIIVETVFAWPGLGLLAINAVGSSDYAVLQGVMIVVTVLYIASSLLVDVLYGLLDPRIRYG